MLICIGGTSASGKTTLSKMLSKKLGATLIEMDNFYHTVEERDKLNLGKNWDNPKMLNWNLFHKVFKKLLKGETVNLPVFDRKEGTRSFTKIQPKEKIILEGIWALNPQTKLTGDLCIFVDAPVTERLSRRIKRDVEERGKSLEKVIKWWNENIIPMEPLHVLPGKDHTDIIVNGMDIAIAVDSILQFL